jgi:ketosteroid isomerase-like protein
MKRAFLLLLFAGGLTVLHAAPASTSKATADITALLTGQAAAWNRGDLDAFMQPYAKTDTLRFASGGNVTLGWQATLDGYRKTYPDQAAMGTLSFTQLEITELAADAAIAFGRWQLTRTKDAPHGLFTLTLQKTAEGWRIIQDHTSAATAKHP